MLDTYRIITNLELDSINYYRYYIMPPIQLGLPALNGWLANAAGILPLSAFISVFEPSSNLHLYELCGSLPLWTWAMTPAGARLLFATLADPTATFGGCYLDRAENTMPVHYIDGRWGDIYPSSSSHTVRLCISACSSVAKMVTAKARMALGSAAKIGQLQGRPLTLEVIRVRLLPTAGEALRQPISGATPLRGCKFKPSHWPRLIS